MNTIINNFLKQISKLKGKWGFVFKIILGIFLLTLSTSYLIWRFPTIIRTGEKQIDTAVIAIAAIILLLPFLAEIEIFGVKFKKEIEKLEKETNEKLKSIDQKLLSIQSQNINQYFYPPKTDEELRKLTETAQQTLNTDKQTKTKVGAAYQVPSVIVDLFTLKWKIRAILKREYKKRSLNTFSNKPLEVLNTHQMIEVLVITNVINEDAGEIIKEVVAICDSAYFGNKITPEQIAFVKENEYIIEYLESL